MTRFAAIITIIFSTVLAAIVAVSEARAAESKEKGTVLNRHVLCNPGGGLMMHTRIIVSILCACLLSFAAHAEDLDVLLFESTLFGADYDGAEIASQLHNILSTTPGFLGSSATHVDVQARYSVEGWYDTDFADVTRQALDGDYDVVVLINTPYNIAGEPNEPESEFEPVLQMSQRILNNGGTPLYMIHAPSEAELPDAVSGGYRIANGCGINAVPGGLAAYEAGLLQPAAGSDELRQAYLIGATIFTQLTGRNASDSGYVPQYGGSPIDSAHLAGIACDVLSYHQDIVHYYGSVSDSGMVRYRPIDVSQAPFNNTVRYMYTGTSTEAGINSHLVPVIQAQGLTAAGVSMGSAREWNASHTAAAQSLFNTYPDQYLFVYTREPVDDGLNIIGANQVNLIPFYHDRHSEYIDAGIDSTPDALDFIYMVFRRAAIYHNTLNFNAILWHAGVGRFYEADPTLIVSSDGTHMTTPLYYMTASMMISSALGIEPVPPAAVSANSQYLMGFNIGHQVVKQLAFLSEDGRDIPDTDLQIDTPLLPPADTGLFYQVTLDANGGTAPYTWEELSDDGLPTGINFSTIGVLSGTPTTVGTNTLVFKVTDANHAIRKKALTIAVNDPASSNIFLDGFESGDTSAWQ